MKVITRMGASVNSVMHSMLITCCTCAPLSIVVPTGLGVHAICDQLLRFLFLKKLLSINILCCRKNDIHEFNIYLIFLIFYNLYIHANSFQHINVIMTLFIKKDMRSQLAWTLCVYAEAAKLE